jgi:CBS domain-containing protein
MRVGDLMQPHVLSTFPEESLSDAAERMRKHGVGSLVVMDGEDMVGVISERDVLAATAEGMAPRVTPVSAYMTADPVVAQPEMEAAEAAALMVGHEIRHLPVVREGEPIGIISARDLLVLEAWPALRKE